MPVSQQRFSSVGVKAGTANWPRVCSVAVAWAARQIKSMYGNSAALRPEKQVHFRAAAPEEPEPGQNGLADEHQAGKNAGEPDDHRAGQLPGAAAVAFQAAGQDGQISGRQGPFAEEFAKEIGDAVGDDEGVHDARAAEQGGHGDVANHSQQAAKQRSQGGDPRPATRRYCWDMGGIRD